MNSYRISVPAELFFTVLAEDREAAMKEAREQVTNYGRMGFLLSLAEVLEPVVYVDGRAGLTLHKTEEAAG